MRYMILSRPVLFAALLVLTTAASLGQEVDPLSLLPEDNEVKGWIKDWEPSLATDLAGLTALIDGAAPQYIDNGAKKVVFQDYTSEGGQFLTVELYYMQNSANAGYIYSLLFMEQPTKFKEIGVESRLAEKLIGAYIFDFWRDSVFVRITTMSKSEEARSASILFAKSIDHKLLK